LATKYIGRVLLTFLVAFSGLILSTSSIFAATFDIHSNDVTGLINAINISNSNGEDNIINLDHNSTYLLTNKISSPYSDIGLPLITGNITINGNESIIKRDKTSLRFRIFAIEAPGFLTLNNITLSKGESVDVINGHENPYDNYDYYGGGAILNLNGTLIINDSIISENLAYEGGGGGIWVENN